MWRRIRVLEIVCDQILRHKVSTYFRAALIAAIRDDQEARSSSERASAELSRDQRTKAFASRYLLKSLMQENTSTSGRLGCTFTCSTTSQPNASRATIGSV